MTWRRFPSREGNEAVPLHPFVDEYPRDAGVHI